MNLNQRSGKATDHHKSSAPNRASTIALADSSCQSRFRKSSEHHLSILREKAEWSYDF